MASDWEKDKSPNTDDRELEELFALYVEQLNRGEKLHPQELLARHPRAGEELLQCLEEFIDSEPPSAGDNGPLGTLGDYTLRRQIGRGGMGVVYEAWENSMDRVVALKVLPAGVAADNKAFVRFMREAKTAGQLHHPNVVHVHGLGLKEQTPYYAMEYVEGETLAQLLAGLQESEPDTETRFGKKNQVGYFGALADAFADVADGLQHAHSKGVIHRDIKPSNLILDQEGRLRILDFGLARLEGQDSLTLSGDFVGTPLYMSPEQAQARKIPVDHRTDIYSLGATMYQALTGTPPFQGKDHHDTLSQIIERDPRPPRQSEQRIPGDLETIVLKCLRKDPGDRYGTAEALGQDLRRFVRGDAIEARAQAGWERAVRRLKRHRVKLFLGAAFLVLAFSIAWLAYGKRRAEYETQALRYEPAVVEVLKKIHAGRFILRVVAGQTESPVRLPEGTLSPVTLRDFRGLSDARGFDPFQQAVEELTAVAEAVPKPDGHYHLARAYRLLDRNDDAVQEVRKALACKPCFVPAEILSLELAGRSLEWGGDRAQEMKRQYGESKWKTLWLDATASMAQKDWNKAVQAYDQLIELRKGEKEPYIGCFTEAYLNRGVAHLKAKEYVLAQSDFAAVQDRTPGFEPVLLLAKAYYLNQQKDEAERTLGNLYRDSSPEEKTEAGLWITAAYESLGDYEKGLEWAETLGETALSDRLRAHFHHRLGNRKEAIVAGRKAIARAEDVTAHLILAAALLKNLWSGPYPERGGELAELLRVSRKAVELAPEDVLARRLLAGAEAERDYEANGSVKESVKEEAMKGKTPGMTLLMVVVLGGQGQAQYGFFDDLRVDENINSEEDEWSIDISADGLELFFARGRESDSWELFVSTRASADSGFGMPRSLTEINTSRGDVGPSISQDGLELYFASNRSGCYQLYVATRDEKRTPFHTVTPLDGLNQNPDLACAGTGRVLAGPEISADGLELFFACGVPAGGVDLYVATRLSREDDFVDFRSLEEINDSSVDEMEPSVSADGLTLFWSDFHGDPRSGGYGSKDIWLATRPTREEPFGGVKSLGPPICGPFSDETCSISSDWPASGSTLYFSRGGVGSPGDFYLATWHPDCNRNGHDDLEDIAEGRAQDCNKNGVPDSCDILSGRLHDENSDGRPDECELFRRADCNDDGKTDITDAVCILGWLFLGEAEPGCVAAANVNGDEAVDTSDPVYLLSYLFLGGAPPMEPFPECGAGGAADYAELGCETTPLHCRP